MGVLSPQRAASDQDLACFAFLRIINCSWSSASSSRIVARSLDLISPLFLRNAFWIGVYPGLTDAMIDYVGHSAAEFIEAAVRRPVRLAS